MANAGVMAAPEKKKNKPIIHQSDPTTGYTCVFCPENLTTFNELLTHLNTPCEAAENSVLKIYPKLLTAAFFPHLSKALALLRPDISLKHLAPQPRTTRGSKNKSQPIHEVEFRCFRDQKYAKSRCHVCGKMVPPSSVRIQNVDLEPEHKINLCVDCFVRGAEKPPHRNFHAYRILGRVTDPLFDPHWTADEELLLLDAIYTYGLGNWPRVSEHVQTKSPSECEIHYISLYCNEENPPIPLADNDHVETMLSVKNLSKPRPYKKPPDPFIHPSIKSRKDLLGLNMKRREFEIEWSQGAEKVLSATEFDEIDSKSETELKNSCCNLYNRKMDKRRERREFLLQRGMEFGCEPRDRKAFRTLHHAYARLARFGKPKEHRAFLSNLVREEEIRKEIQKLQMYRINGFTSLREVDEYNKEMKKQKEKYTNWPLHSSSYNPSSFGTSTRRKRRGNYLEKEDRALERIKKRRISSIKNEPQFQNIPTDVDKKFCAQLNITPNKYIEMRQTLLEKITEYGLCNPGQKDGKPLLRIKVDKHDDIEVGYAWAEHIPC